MNIYSKNKQRLCKNTLKKQQNIILKTKKSRNLYESGQLLVKKNANALSKNIQNNINGMERERVV